MSLIQCPECEREVSDQAASCPHCGYPLRGARDLWRVQLFSPNRLESIDKFARYVRSVSPVEWKRKGDSLVTKDLYPKSIAEEILREACPSHSKDCAKLLPPDPDEPLPEISDATRCPKCGSYSIKSESRGFRYGRAAFGTALFGTGGAVAGIESGGKVCANCGCKF